MREIKFRVFFYDSKDESTGVYYDAELAYSECFIEFLGNSLFPTDECPIIEQFTGLHDRNRTPIYEGDIVGFRNNRKLHYVVEWLDGGFSARWDKSTAKVRKEEYKFPLPNNTEVWEVIGNIHENKELLK